MAGGIYCGEHRQNSDMKTRLIRCGWTFGFSILVAAQAAQFKFPTQTFTLPDGFEVELAAGTDLAPRPVSASFDERGRLYVTDSSGSNEKPEIQLKNPDHRILRLEDADGDGKFDKSIVFADKVMFPEGCLYYDGSVYVAAPPSIWKFTDTDSDGVADKREEWFQGKTLTGCANDLHGPYLGPDGYIYWTKGAFAEQTHKLGNGRILKDKAAHIFRARPDGSDLDVIMSGGMDNPVEVAFTPEGEVIFTSTFIDFSQPGYRDGIAHAVYGGVFGKIHDVIEDGRVKRTSPEVMQPFYQAGPSAITALWRYESNIFGDEYRDNFFATSFNLRKVTRHILRPNGATFASTDSDFLVSDNTDFHPTDVLEDADGSLLVVDTGGWYKLCCPSSQLAKPDVLGAIYRVRRQGAPKLDDPWGARVAWTRMNPVELVKLLEDNRPTVRNRAVHRFGKLGDSALPALTNCLATASKLSVAQSAVFALQRSASPKAAEALWASFGLNSASHIANEADLIALRHTKFKALSGLRAVPASDQARLMLDFTLACEVPVLRRVAAELTGRIGDADRTFSLFRAVAERGSDPMVMHSAVFAAIEINSPQSLRQQLALYAENPSNALQQAVSPQVRIASLIALDQMDSSDLKPADVTPHLAASDPELRKTAAWVASHHPDWGGALAGFFRERLNAQNLSEADRPELGRQLAQFAGDSAIQNLMGQLLGSPGSALSTKQAVLEAILLANLKSPPAVWGATVASLLAAKSTDLLSPAIAAVRVLGQAKTNAPDFSAALLGIGKDETQTVELRLEALAAMPGGMKSVEPSLLRFLCANFDPAKSVSVRNSAASVLAKAKLNDDQLLALTETIKTTGPLEVTKLLTAFEQSQAEAVGLKLMAALRESKGLSGARPDAIKALAAKFPASVQEKSADLLALLNADEASQKAHLDALLASLPKGDVRAGQAVFNSQRTACAACHKMGYVGGTVGPDLTSIGQARTERDLLEAIVYPNVSFVRSYEPVIVTTKSDEEYSGVLRKDGADEIILATGPATEARIARSDINEMRPSQVSVMPGGLDEQLTKQELADLVAFLKNTKWGVN